MKCTEAVIMGSGPSLTAEDCELVRTWRTSAEGRAVIVTNSTFRIAPWADVLFAMDKKWWRNSPDACTFAGLKVCVGDVCRQVTHVRLGACGNSGCGAMLYAHSTGARRLILLAFDGMAHGNKAHWHPDHPKPLGNAGSWRAWPHQMDSALKRLPKSVVVNASRWTVYKRPPRVVLEEALGLKQTAVA
jgi:hypothetical protein